MKNEVFLLREGFSASPVPAEIRDKMNGKTYRDNSEIDLDDLSYLKVRYLDFDHRIADGELIVHKTLAKEVLEIFEMLFEAEYEIEKIRLCDEYNGGRPMKVVANLPYYITTPMVMARLESRAPIRSITVMVQKEVADRMQAGPGTKDYGALSLAVRYHSRAKIVADVPPNCFMPRPKVGSAVIHLDCEGMELLPEEEEKRLFALIKAAFGQRRKTLPNAVAGSGALPYDRETVAAALERLGLKPTVRGEALELAQFEALARELDRRN